jgi:ABC-type sugar transport system ATPase subunit
LDIKLGPPLLEVENLSSGERFAEVSFDVRAGEIYGIAGLVGAGRTEILKTIFGALPMTGGRIRVDGKGYTPHSPRRSLQDGMVLTPEDRKAEGLILPFSIRQNIALSTLKALSRSAVVIVSSDLLELLGLCDRIGVMRAGRMAGEVERADFSQDRLMSLAAVG